MALRAGAGAVDNMIDQQVAALSRGRNRDARGLARGHAIHGGDAALERHQLMVGFGARDLFADFGRDAMAVHVPKTLHVSQEAALFVLVEARPNVLHAMAQIFHRALPGGCCGIAADLVADDVNRFAHRAWQVGESPILITDALDMSLWHEGVTRESEDRANVALLGQL